MCLSIVKPQINLDYYILLYTTTNYCFQKYQLPSLQWPQYMGAFIAYRLSDCSLMSALIKNRMGGCGGAQWTKKGYVEIAIFSI